jgi:hypothetical protein
MAMAVRGCLTPTGAVACLSGNDVVYHQASSKGWSALCEMRECQTSGPGLQRNEAVHEVVMRLKWSFAKRLEFGITDKTMLALFGIVLTSYAPEYLPLLLTPWR